METDEERKARLEKMIATTQLRLALETEEERRAKRNGFDLEFDFKNTFFSARAVMGTIFLFNLFYILYVNNHILVRLGEGGGGDSRAPTYLYDALHS